MTEAFYRYQLTIDNILDSAVRRNPDQTIEYRDAKTITYREFGSNAKRLAKSLIKIGASKGDIIAVIDWDTDRYLTAYYSVPMAGCTLHTVNIRYPPELIYYTMKDAGDKYVIIRDEFVPLIENFMEMFSFIKGWIVYSESGEVSTKLKPFYNYDDLVNDRSVDSVELPELNENDVATVFYTSGTTGMPKGVSFTHRDLTLHTLALMAGATDDPINVRSNDAILPLVPMFHVHSWGFPFWVLLKGNKYVLPGKYEYGRILELIEKHGVTFSAMVPPILYLILAEKEAARILSKSHLRAIIGGAALPEGMARAAEKLGVSLISGYGMSETAPVLTLSTYTNMVRDLPEEEKFYYRLKSGVPVFLVKLRVVDSELREVPWDSSTIGEVVVRTPWLTSGYWKNEEESAKLWKGGWLHTGDLGVIDENGYVKLVDREKDAVKSGGEFIPSLMLEDVISTVDGVEEVAVVGKPDEKWGERPVAFVTVKGEFNESAIREELNKAVELGRIGKFWIPDEFIRVDEFTKTSTGKIDKKPLKSRYKS